MRPELKQNIELAVEQYNSGYNCAETTLLGICRHLNLESAQIPRVASGFGGGIARSQNICGALSGAAMGIGLAHGRNDGHGDRLPSYWRIQQLLQKFKERFKSLDCRTLTGIDFSNPEEVARDGQRIHHEVCGAYVRFAIELACGLIDQAEPPSVT